MLLVGSENAGVGLADGMRILRAGGRALDAVEATIRRVESNPADHSVGYGGLPNIPGGGRARRCARGILRAPPAPGGAERQEPAVAAFRSCGRESRIGEKGRSVKEGLYRVYALNVLGRRYLAGRFQLSTSGRLWVSTEARFDFVVHFVFLSESRSANLKTNAPTHTRADTTTTTESRVIQ